MTMVPKIDKIPLTLHILSIYLLLTCVSVLLGSNTVSAAVLPKEFQPPQEIHTIPLSCKDKQITTLPTIIGTKATHFISDEPSDEAVTPVWQASGRVEECEREAREDMDMVEEAGSVSSEKWPSKLHSRSEKEMPGTGPDDAQSKSLEDKSLDMRPGKFEPVTTAAEAGARFDFFKTEPTFRSARISIEHITDDMTRLVPGYYFIAPYGYGGRAPQIFAQDGQLIYWGANEATGRVTNFSPCNHFAPNGLQTNLCWSESFFDEWEREQVRHKIFDSTYSQIGRSWGASGGWNYPNNHELQMLGETLIQIVYQIKMVDLTNFGGDAKGWVYDGCFQEVCFESGRVIFSWCATEHFSLHHTTLYLDIPNQRNITEGIAGKGTFTRPWDFVHLNSVHKMPGGDYMVSARHFSSIFKVAGLASPSSPGTVLWQLNGKENDFTFDNFTFSRQHDARFLSSDGHTTMMSVFNNALTTRNAVALNGVSSTGQLIKIDEAEMSATLLQEYVHPHRSKGWRESVAIAEGSFDLLGNIGSAVIGWGSLGDISEYSVDGECIFHANIADHAGRTYRAFKRRWVSSPRWPPKLLVYTQACNSEDFVNGNGIPPLVAYVSWNGATEVASWHFSVSVISQRGPWLSVGSFAKQGFETKVNFDDSWILRALQTFIPYVRVEALDRDGKILGNTTATTFVPRPELLCQRDGCADANFTYDSTFNINADGETCRLSARGFAPAAVVLMALLICVESGMLWANVIFKKLWTTADCSLAILPSAPVGVTKRLEEKQWMSELDSHHKQSSAGTKRGLAKQQGLTKI